MTNAATTRKWRKLNGTTIKIPISEEIEDAIIREKNAGNELTICIGTDSQVKGATTEMATVIVFVRKGKGAFMYINSDKSQQKMTIKERMLAEVARSIEVGYELLNIFDMYDVDFEIHVDINTNPLYKSNDALKEALGYVLGMGFTFKAKPFAFASSCCANKIVQ